MSNQINALKQADLNHFQEDLAKTYFSTPHAKPQPQPKQPQETRAVNISRPWRFFWIAFSLLLIGFTAVLFVLDKVEIDVRIIPALLSYNAQANTVFFDKKGEPNRDIIRETVFYENASAESSWGKKFVTLANDIGSKKAMLGIEFANPLNTKEGTFCFSAKGDRGGEEMRIILKDAANNFCYSKTNVLQDTWQLFAIDTAQAKDFIDTEKITYMNLELNPAEKNGPRSKIYLKGLSLKNKQGGLT
ncbi:MAG: hypothetical protein NTV07_04320 [Candidatus Omnitrophica bacterium]|nr:hypothetical protein [Candidatus Omnitrophota bacterium]